MSLFKECLVDVACVNRETEAVGSEGLHVLGNTGYCASVLRKL